MAKKKDVEKDIHALVNLMQIQTKSLKGLEKLAAETGKGRTQSQRKGVKSFEQQKKSITDMLKNDKQYSSMQSMREQLSERLMISHRKQNLQLLRDIVKGGDKTQMPGSSPANVFQKAKAAGAAMRNMISPKQKQGGGQKNPMADAMKGVMKFAIGGGIVAMFAKKLFQSSPMLQQMMKLFNFGIMMILRPIGDFLGFMLRPILLMLMRKFIIPFYKDALPKMQELGDMVGQTLVPIIENIALGIGAFSAMIYNLLTLQWTKASEEFVKLQTIMDGTVETQETAPQVLAAGEAIKGAIESASATNTKEYQETVDALNALRNAPASKQGTATMTELSKQISAWTNQMAPLLKKDGLMKVGRETTQAMTAVAEGQTLEDAMYQFAKSMFKGGINTYAEGGIINEPVVGVGKSGKGYLLGEAGAERVTPIGGSGGSVTINVYGDVNDKAINEFERKVLEVLNKSNTRRGF